MSIMTRFALSIAALLLVPSIANADCRGACADRKAQDFHDEQSCAENNFGDGPRVEDNFGDGPRVEDYAFQWGNASRAGYKINDDAQLYSRLGYIRSNFQFGADRR